MKPPPPSRVTAGRAAALSTVKQAKRSSIAQAISKAAQWHLRLYVAGQTMKTRAAITHLKKICEDHLGGRYKIEVIDLRDAPERAARDQIFAVPTLVRYLPASLKRIVGDLSNMDRVLLGLDLHPTKIRIPQRSN